MSKLLIERQKEFVNLRNGTFIHFNSATEQFSKSEVCDWDYGITRSDDPKRHVFDPKTWNPTKLDCRQWAQTAKSSQSTFAALTTKHHEGFCLWPTKTTTHSVSYATNQTDVVKEYLTAFRDAGILPGFYYSIIDLHHGITLERCDEEDKKMIKEQLKELLTNYGEIPFIIFDGWQAPWGGPSYERLPFEEINDFIKELQPNCLVMNIGSGENIETTDIIFYENAAGQDADIDFIGPGASCNIYTNTWFWREEHTTMDLKSVSWGIEKVEQCNKQNISFLMNISPNNQGIVEDNLVERFVEFGQKYEKSEDVVALPEGWKYRKN